MSKSFKVNSSSNDLLASVMTVVGGVVLALLLACLIAVLTALPVMLLWNALMPEIFGLVTIDFWQALGLSVLSQCLFKGSSSSGKDS